MRQIVVSWPTEDQKTWKTFLEICQRDGHSASSEILAFVKSEVARRSPGNPQTPLERYEKTPREDLQAMTLSQLSMLYEGVKARLRLADMPSEDEIARFRLIQREMNERERVLRMR